MIRIQRLIPDLDAVAPFFFFSFVEMRKRRGLEPTGVTLADGLGGEKEGGHG